MTKKIPFEAVIKVTMEAGEILTKQFGKVKPIRNKGTFAVSAVTDFDIAIEKLIAEKLKRLDPTIGFKGEESGLRGNSRKFWLVDPIDGTAHFIRGIPFCTTMIALIDNGMVELSVIYNFVTNELFAAEKNRGATLNGKRISVSSRPLRDAYISVESNLKNRQDLKLFLALRENCVVVHTISCRFEYGLIASGKLDGRICFNPYGGDFDYAAGALLVAETGGVVANIGKSSYDYRNHDFIATNKIIYEELTQGKNPIFPTLHAPRTKHAKSF